MYEGGTEVLGREGCFEEELVPLLIARGLAVPVSTFEVSVTLMGGRTFRIKMDNQTDRVKDLKVAIQAREGISRFNQNVFLVPKQGEQAKEAPMKDEEVLEGSSSLALYVDGELLMRECSCFLV